jgi:hypothetical protein
MNQVQNTIAEIFAMDKDQLNQVVEAIKLRRTQLARAVTRAVSVGDIVEFDARGRVVRGTVTKVNTKTLQVREDRGGLATTNWKVTASLVRAVETA